MPKRSIRDTMLQRRRALPVDDVCARSLQVQNQVLSSPEFATARTLALYSPFRHEVQTEVLFRAARAAGKSVVFPRVKGDQLDFVRVSSLDDLLPGSFGVSEPCGTEVVSILAIDLLLLPGLAFDLIGHRLGYGRGFYDRALEGAEKSPLLRAGLAFDFQLIEALPAQGHDIRIDILFTESTVRRFAQSAREQYRKNQPTIKEEAIS
jgi:5-formyltetrahydrofolate cyclo-ligase